jgi:hypothetical protein
MQRDVPVVEGGIAKKAKMQRAGTAMNRAVRFVVAGASSTSATETIGG